MGGPLARTRYGFFGPADELMASEAGPVGVVVTRNESQGPAPNAWPAAPAPARADTRATLHLWTQVVGKVRLTLVPMTNC